MMAGHQPDTDEFAGLLLSVMPTTDHSKVQQDIDEFLKILIDKSVPQLPSHNFLTKPILTCLECGHAWSRPEEPYSSCIMNPCGKSIQKGLKAALADDEVDVNCEKCQKDIRAEKQNILDFSQTEVFTVFIRRTLAVQDKNGTFTTKKDLTTIHIARFLTPDNLCNDKQKPNYQADKFELFAFINHLGEEAVSCCFCYLKYMCSF